MQIFLTLLMKVLPIARFGPNYETIVEKCRFIVLATTFRQTWRRKRNYFRDGHRNMEPDAKGKKWVCGT